MEPTTAPMTLQSPLFVIIVLLILLAAGVSYMIFAFMSKARDASSTAVYDPARSLTISIMGMVWLLILFTGGIIIAQIIDRGSANTESWAAFTGIIGWATAKAGDIFNNRFGSTKESADKNQTIAQQARTAAVTTDALLDPKVVVSTGDGGAPMPRATLDHPADAKPPAGAIQAENVTVAALNTTVNEVDPKKDQ